jgi:nitrogen fixation NifU-like protein
MHSRGVLDYFGKRTHAGELPAPALRVDVTNPACGDTLRLTARVEGGRIEVARYLAQGCVATMACAAWLAEWLEGRGLAELPRLTPAEVSRALGGLGEAALHAAQLACDAAAALARLRPQENSAKSIRRSAGGRPADRSG